MSLDFSKTRNQFELLEQKRIQLIARLQTISPEQYLTNITPTSWSPAQIAHHIFLSETLSHRYLQKKLTYPHSLQPAGLFSRTKNSWIKFIFFTRLKIKAPATIDVWQKEVHSTPEQLNAKWIEERQALISFLETQYPLYGDMLAFRHPFAGRMTMYQMMVFLNDHMAHHMKQIDRIVKRF